MATEKKDTVILTTSDDENFTVERKVAERSVLIKSMLDGTYGLFFYLRSLVSSSFVLFHAAARSR
jgi:hypothetical protein